MKSARIVSIIALSIVAACSSTVNGSAPSSPSCLGNTTDGSSTCNGNVCAGGQYCTDQVIHCSVGCLSTGNCRQGEVCDLSSAQATTQGPVGICRSCAPSQAGPSAPAACTDVHGAYSVSLDPASSSACSKAVASSSTIECTLVQTACTVDATCLEGGRAFSFTSTLSGSTGSTTLEGLTDTSGNPVAGTCSVTFSAGAPTMTFTFECTLTEAAGSAVCVFDGTHK